MFKSESLKNLAPALVRAQKKMGTAFKDSKNPFYKSKYADLNAVIDAVVPAYNEENIAVLQTPQVINGVQVIQTVLLHESGEFYSSDTMVVAAKSNDPQAAGSAISYARRYGLQATTTCKAEDDDGEASMGRKETASKMASPEVKPEVKTFTSAGIEAVSNSGNVDKPTPVAKNGWASKAKKTEAKPQNADDGY